MSAKVVFVVDVRHARRDAGVSKEIIGECLDILCANFLGTSIDSTIQLGFQFYNSARPGILTPGTRVNFRQIESESLCKDLFLEEFNRKADKLSLDTDTEGEEEEGPGELLARATEQLGRALAHTTADFSWSQLSLTQQLCDEAITSSKRGGPSRNHVVIVARVPDYQLAESNLSRFSETIGNEGLRLHWMDTGCDISTYPRNLQALPWQFIRLGPAFVPLSSLMDYERAHSTRPCTEHALQMQVDNDHCHVTGYAPPQLQVLLTPLQSGVQVVPPSPAIVVRGVLPLHNILPRVFNSVQSYVCVPCSDAFKSVLRSLSQRSCALVVHDDTCGTGLLMPLSACSAILRFTKPQLRLHARESKSTTRQLKTTSLRDLDKCLLELGPCFPHVFDLAMSARVPAAHPPEETVVSARIKQLREELEATERQSVMNEPSVDDAPQREPHRTDDSPLSKKAPDQGKAILASLATTYQTCVATEKQDVRTYITDTLPTVLSQLKGLWSPDKESIQLQKFMRRKLIKSLNALQEMYWSADSTEEKQRTKLQEYELQIYLRFELAYRARQPDPLRRKKVVEIGKLLDTTEMIMTLMGKNFTGIGHVHQRLVEMYGMTFPITISKLYERQDCPLPPELLKYLSPSKHPKEGTPSPQKLPSSRKRKAPPPKSAAPEKPNGLPGPLKMSNLNYFTSSLANTWRLFKEVQTTQKKKKKKRKRAKRPRTSSRLTQPILADAEPAGPASNETTEPGLQCSRRLFAGAHPITALSAEPINASAAEALSVSPPIPAVAPSVPANIQIFASPAVARNRSRKRRAGPTLAVMETPMKELVVRESPLSERKPLGRVPNTNERSMARRKLVL